MNEIEIYKLIITIFNIVILIGLPYMFAWHWACAKKMYHNSDEWLTQILIIFVYGLAINAEIPALWSRWRAYYILHIKLTDGMYILSTWDREGHAIFYAALFFLTFIFTRKKIPQIIKDTIG